MRARRGRGRPWVALLLSVVALTGGIALMLADDAGQRAEAASTFDLEGEAWIMSGVAYNTQQPAPDSTHPLHYVALPEGGTNDTPLNYAFPSSSELLLYSATSSHVQCNSQGNTPGATSAIASCEVVIKGFQLWVGPYQIIEADMIRVASTSVSTATTSNSYPTISIQGLCVYIEQDYANGCVTPQPGGTVTINRPPITGTVKRGGSETFPSNGNQLGSGSNATAFHINLLNEDYPTSTGIRAVTIDIGFAETFAGMPWPTPTPTRTATPTKTPTPNGTPTPTNWGAVLPGLSRDE